VVWSNGPAYCFACGNLVVPAPFVEKTSVPTERHSCQALVMDVWVYFRTLFCCSAGPSLSQYYTDFISVVL
jgi:hypothetical protein